MDELRWLLGEFRGQGTNHEGQTFDGRLTVTPLVGTGLALAFIATSLQGDVFHQDQSWLAPKPDGALGFWTISNNLPMVLEHQVDLTADLVLAKAGGPTDDQTTLRHHCQLKKTDDGVHLQFFWGIPGHDFGPRSSVSMSQQ